MVVGGGGSCSPGGGGGGGPGVLGRTLRVRRVVGEGRKEVMASFRVL